MAPPRQRVCFSTMPFRPLFSILIAENNFLFLPFLEVLPHWNWRFMSISFFFGKENKKKKKKKKTTERTRGALVNEFSGEKGGAAERKDILQAL